MKFGIVVFPGSNCDRDMAYVTQEILRQPTRLIWHQQTNLADIDVLIIPGGFSYGDYLRCGALARFSPVMEAVQAHAAQGKLVLGVCNGFQILTESGLLPGTLIRNQGLHFVCDRVAVRVERNDLPWTREYLPQEVITLPIAHGEGCYYADSATLASLAVNRQIVLRYHGSNPNGSLEAIAGICNLRGNVLGMMPHPERAADQVLGLTDGLKLFQGILLGVAA